MTLQLEEEGLSSSEVVEQLAGRMTYRQLDYWIRVGRVTPSITLDEKLPSGRAPDRRWSLADVIALERILDMLESHERDIDRLSSGQMWEDLHREPARRHLVDVSL